jgi:hypothetical protein
MYLKIAKLIPLLGLLLFLGAACGGLQPKPAALSNEQLHQVIDNSLQALSAGDKTAFTQDFSETMKQAYTDEEFNKLRELVAESSGQYTSCGEPQLSNAQGYTRYSFPCEYEKEEVVATFVFQIDGSLVEGLFFNSANLRKLTQ